MKRSKIDGKRLEKFGESWYKVSEVDHLGFCRIIEPIQSIENYKAYEKLVTNSSYGTFFTNFVKISNVSQDF